MTTYNTGNALGSVDVRDLYDNAQNLDMFSNSANNSEKDRFGVSRETLQGIRNASQYQFLGAYAAGLVFTSYNQVFSNAGEFYAPSAGLTLPYTTTGSGAAEIATFRGVGDAVLRQDLANATAPAKGAGLVGVLREPATAPHGTIAQVISAVAVSVWEYANLVTVKPTPADPSTWDWGPAMQAAHNENVVVHYPQTNEYKHSATITLSLFGSAVVGDANKYSSPNIRYTGSGVAWAAQAAVNYMLITGVHIVGTPTVGTDYYNTGSIALDTTLGAVSVVAVDAWISNFETILNSNFNSFYNRFSGCRIEKFKDGFLNVSANNFVIDSGTRIQGFNRLFRAAGSGPINISESSIELFNGPIVESPTNQILLNFKNNYVETIDSANIPTNFPANTLGDPLKFGGNILFTGSYSTIAIQNNELQIPGSRRIGSFTTCDVLSSRGNNISIYATGNNIDRMYFSTNPVKHLDILDRRQSGFGAGPYATAYIQEAIVGTVDGDYYFYDAIGLRVFLNTSLIVAPTLANGWTAPSVADGNPRLIKDGGVLRLSGQIDGAASTAAQVFTVPSNLRPYEYGTTRSFANFTLFAGGGAGNQIRFRYFYDTGVFQLEGAPANKNLIPIDGIVIPERY